MLRFIVGLFKVLLACLLMGAVLTFFGITTPVLLSVFRLTPEDVRIGLERAYIWSLPRILLGAVIVLPAWLFIYIFIPPRGGE
ncbi:hypothetical protein [Rhizobium terrae]|uniref:hypothetical protein n=1 Tax=Rhizobium terrae TaxID=2171756 RepID=UPI0013C33803|nr:hypothetical protein [Rhizobium terrae]